MRNEERASSQVLAADTGVQKQCCAQCMQFVQSLLQRGGGDVSSLVATAKVSIAYPFQRSSLPGPSRVFSPSLPFIITDHR